jgi:hypothetical protein
MFRDYAIFTVRVVSNLPNPQAGRPHLVGCQRLLFNIFAATLHIGGRTFIRNPKKRHASATGTHLSWVIT